MSPSPKSPARTYKIALSAMFLLFLLGMAATMIFSARRGSGVTDSQYYRNGLNYDRTASGARNPGLFWTMSASLEGRDLLVRVHDENGAPIGGGELLFQPGRGGQDQSRLNLVESAPGVFRAPWPAPPEGEVQGTLRFSRGEASASQKVVFFN